MQYVIHSKLTGTKKGCDHGQIEVISQQIQCGACTVLVNGRLSQAILSGASPQLRNQATEILCRGLAARIS